MLKYIKMVFIVSSTLKQPVEYRVVPTHVSETTRTHLRIRMNPLQGLLQHLALRHWQ